MKKRVEKAYKYRFYPTEDQKENFAKTFGSCRFVYNYFLTEWNRSWKEDKKSLTYSKCSLLLRTLKVEYEWLKDVSSVCLQQSLRHLDKAFQNFFAKRTKFPSLKKKGSTQSATYMKNSFSFKDRKLVLAKQKEALNIRWSRTFSGEVTSLTITKDGADRYFVSLLVLEEVESFPFTIGQVGIDLGVSDIIVDDKGSKLVNPAFLKKGLKRLRRSQRSLSRKIRGSRNREKAKRKVAKCHAKIKDKRTDFLHKVSSKLVNENQVIVAEDLSVKKMQKNKNLARSIADSSFATLLRFLEYKCNWFGREFVTVAKFFPGSKRCSSCYSILESLALGVRSWQCPKCHVVHDRDTNAAKNHLKEGLRILGEKLGVPRGSRDFKPVESM